MIVSDRAYAVPDCVRDGFGQLFLVDICEDNIEGEKTVEFF